VFKPIGADIEQLQMPQQLRPPEGRKSAKLSASLQQNWSESDVWVCSSVAKFILKNGEG